MLRQSSSSREFTPVPRTDGRPIERSLSFANAAYQRADSRASTLSVAIAAGELDTGTLDALIERLPIAIAMADRDGRMVYANALARALPLSGVAELDLLVAETLLTGFERSDTQREFCNADRTRRWFTITASPVRDTDGQTGAVLLTISDTTECVQATEWRPLIESLARL